MGKHVRVGGASAFWGDSAVGPIQLVERADVDYLIFDYLAETTMAILAGARSKDPALGYATDFVDVAMRDILRSVAKKRIKVITNAGGINPAGCAAALARLSEKQQVPVRIAVVEGDDVHGRLATLETTSFVDGVTRVDVPSGTLSANAYLGAAPIVKALALGADIVITGRCVDSALTLGALIHEFGWTDTDYDRLAAGSLAGHIVECGCQATGGLHTDWQNVPNWADIGYPVIECDADGMMVVTKPPDTGGLVNTLGVAEQLLYEIGDPSEYLLPDVTCDFSQVRITQEGPERVRLSGARGLPPTDQYKVSATRQDGFRSSGTMILIGRDATAKAQRTGEAILERTRSMLVRMGLEDYSATRVEVIGAETMYGPHARREKPREVMMRVTVTHRSREALELFGREIAPSGTSWAPGTTSPPVGRPSPSPLIRQFSCLIPKADVEARVLFEGKAVSVKCPSVPCKRGRRRHQSNDGPDVHASSAEPTVTVPLISLACARSGDKGDTSNIGVIARRPEYLPVILSQLTASAVGDYFRHLVNGRVHRYLVPGIQACNFVLEEALDGGGPASLRMDPLGKSMAQMLLDFEVRVPENMARSLERHATE